MATVWRWLGLLLACGRLAAAEVTITNVVDGSGLVLGTGTYESGASVTLRAVPQVDWKFDHWEGVPAELATNNPLTLEAVSGLQPKAVFTAAPGNGRFKGGTVVAWGANPYGQTSVPAGLSGVVGIAADKYNSVARWW